MIRRPRPAFGAIWLAGTGVLAGEIRCSILPIRIGDGISFFEKLDRGFVLHLAQVEAFETGMVELRCEVRGRRPECPDASYDRDAADGAGRWP